MRKANNYYCACHLNNVRVVIADQRVPVSESGVTVAYYKPKVLEISDYYPYGWQKFLGKYQFGANAGSLFENWDSSRGTYYTLYRLLDARIARWYQVEPKWERYAWMSPYVVNSGNPVLYIDPLGDYPRGLGRKLDKFFWNAKLKIRSLWFRIFRKKWVKVKVKRERIMWFRFKDTGDPVRQKSFVGVVSQDYLDKLYRRTQSSDTMISKQATRLYNRIMKQINLSIKPDYYWKYTIDSATGKILDVRMVYSSLIFDFYVPRGNNRNKRKVPMIFDVKSLAPRDVYNYYILHEGGIIKRFIPYHIVKRGSFMMFYMGFLYHVRKSLENEAKQNAMNYNSGFMLGTMLWTPPLKMKIGYVDR